MNNPDLSHAFNTLDDVYKFTGTLIEDGHTPFAVAAAFTLVALQMYKTSMTDEDYNKMVDSISESRGRVKSLTEMANKMGKLN